MKRLYCSELDARRLLRYERKRGVRLDKLDDVLVKGSGGLNARADCFSFFLGQSTLKGKATVRAVASAALRCGYAPAVAQGLLANPVVQSRIKYYRMQSLTPEDYDELRGLALSRLVAGATTSPADYMSTPSLDAGLGAARGAAGRPVGDDVVHALDNTEYVDGLLPQDNGNEALDTRGASTSCHKDGGSMGILEGLGETPATMPAKNDNDEGGGGRGTPQEVPGAVARRGGPTTEKPSNFRTSILSGLESGLAEPGHRKSDIDETALAEYESSMSIDELMMELEEVEEDEKKYSYLRLADGNLVRHRGIDELPANALMALKGIKIKNLGNAKEPILVYEYDVYDGRDSAELLLKYIGDIGSNQKTETELSVNAVADILGRAAKRVESIGSEEIVEAELGGDGDGEA